MQDVFQELYNVILDRRENPQEGSYTCYLFEKGTDKILKKVAEESEIGSIAAKNGVKEDTVAEIGDLLFHLLVLMANEGIDVSDVTAELARRRQKSGNLKQFHQVDKNT